MAGGNPWAGDAQGFPHFFPAQLKYTPLPTAADLVHYVIMTSAPDYSANTSVDISELASLLRRHRKKEGKTLREVSAETGVPFSTLSRVESGKLPDLTTFRNIVAWLGVPPERFFPTPRVRLESTPEMVAQVLRKDPDLTDDAREQLEGLVSQMYTALTVNRQLIQMHLRSGRTFTPEAGGLLADLLSQMQEKLVAEKGKKP